MSTLSKAFTPSTKLNPCRLCGDIKGKCRETGESLILCMELSGARKGDRAAASDNTEFEYRKLSSNGLWGIWAEAKDDSRGPDFDRAEWRAKKASEAKARQMALAAAMTASERDTWYRNYFAGLPLSDSDRAMLQSKGLTDSQINEWGIKSLDFGTVYPIRDVAGLIVGAQIRLTEPGDSGRYRWHGTPGGKHLPNTGELPLSVFHGVSDGNVAALCEGTGVKSYILNQRSGLLTVGAAGGLFAASSETLKTTLERCQVKRIRFYPDAGCFVNEQVMRQYEALFTLLADWGYDCEIGYWGHGLSKDEPDIDELPDWSRIEYLSVSRFLALAAAAREAERRQNGKISFQYDPAIESERDQRDKIRSLGAQVSREEWESKQLKNKAIALFDGLKQKVKATEFKGFKPVNPVVQAKDPNLLEYQSTDERVSVWKYALTQKAKILLDTSGTGSGKSFTAGTLKPDQFGEGTRQIIYISTSHRNPTTETLGESNGWVDLEARHGGLTKELTPNGEYRLKRVGAGDIPSIPANCGRNKLIGVLRTKNIGGADAASVACGGCPLKEACGHSEGPGYGFLNQRRSALSSPLLRAHPDSLPDPENYDYKDVILVWEEAGESFRVKRTVDVRQKDLEQTIAALLHHPDLFQQLQPVLTALLNKLDGTEKLGFYGVDHAGIMESLGNFTGDINAVERALMPDLSVLNTTANHGVNLEDLPPSLRKKFALKAGDAVLEVDERVLKQWLPELLRILSGEMPGATAKIDRAGLHISLPDSRHKKVATAAAGVIYLDATLSREELALRLNIPSEQVMIAKQYEAPSENLAITQVVDMGRMGMQRGADQQRRATALIQHYQNEDPTTKVIDFKKFTVEGQGAWWRDSRGSNDFLNCKTLILIGTPCRNVNDCLADYAAMTGRTTQDEAFQDFIDRQIRADFQQAIGRLRANRRPDEQLRIIVISNFDLGLSEKQVKAKDITPQAAPKHEVFLLSCQDAVRKLFDEGKKITQKAVSAITGYSQGYISRIWEILQMLLEALNSKSNNFEESPPDPVAIGVIEDSIRDAESTEHVHEVVLGLLLEWIEPDKWRFVIPHLSINAQSLLVESILMALPEGDLSTLRGAIA